MDTNIVFIDIDGTLLQGDGTVPASAVQAIRRSREAGNKIFLCTGRSIAEIFDWMLEIGFDGVVSSGGGCVEIDGKIVYNVKFNRDELCNIMKFLDDHKVDYILEANHGLFASPNCRSHIECITDDDYFLEHLTFDEDLQSVKDINKIAFLEAELPFEEIHRRFCKDYQVVPCTVPVFGAGSGEIALKGIHKASAVELVLQQLQIDWEKSFALGDGYNDIEMIQYVKHGIAMKSGNPELLAVADDVTDAPEDDGILHCFEKYGLL